MTVLIYNTARGILAQAADRWFFCPVQAWDELINLTGLHERLQQWSRSEPAAAPPEVLLAPLGSQEIWAAGVTYLRSRSARASESQSAGASSFYDRVYDAERPELFFKSTAARVVAPGGTLRLRRDARWIVPEPELTLVINARREIIGCTIGNDLTCRDLEAENPLYLAQAKIYEGSASVGPAVLISPDPLPAETRIDLDVRRHGASVSAGSTSLGRMRRRPGELRDFLCRELEFPQGCYLMTGTGIVPEDSFSLQSGDEVRITIEPIGTLTNIMG
ncbi:MAG: fumarylacetoacetate hydrolase family protein [Steroidobacteraceae bacterium]